MLIGYGKIGRSMPLTLQKCGVNGGDTETIPPIKTLALRHPNDTFVLVGRNSGETAAEVGLPYNVVNPWTEWGWLDDLKKSIRAAGLNHINLSVDEHLQLRAIHDRITMSTFARLDGYVLWIGQHGTSNGPNTMISDPSTLTKPYDSFGLYGAHLLRGINIFREEDPHHKEEVLLNADPRNYVKYRDTRWPLKHPVQTQFNFKHNMQHERFGDTSSPVDCGYLESDDTVWPNRPDNTLWGSEVTNVYTRLEVNGLQRGTPFGDIVRFDSAWNGRGKFGLFVNYAGSRDRAWAVRDYVLPMNPDFIHGSWTHAGRVELGQYAPNISPAPWDQYFSKLHSVHCTMAVPSNSGWATTKAWEAFAAGTVCFFHPNYDTQNNILGDADDDLRAWLRVRDPSDLRQRVEYLHGNRSAWTWLVNAQRAHFDRAIRELDYMKAIEKRLYG